MLSAANKNRLVKAVTANAFRLASIAAIVRLGRRRDQRAQRLCRALRASLTGKLDSGARSWSVRIEALRARLVAMTQTVEIDDFGADRKVDLGADRMYQGRTRTRTVGEISASASKSPAEARLLMELVRQLEPELVLELGTCVGISTAYQGAALALNRHGHIVTIEGSPALAQIAATNLAELGLDNCDICVGRFQDQLGNVLGDRADLGLAFIDGHHDEQATIDYFDRIKPHLAAGAVVVFDDIRWSRGMRRAWRAVGADPSVSLAVDLGTLGVCFVA